jgi:hypothetical protein
VADGGENPGRDLRLSLEAPRVAPDSGKDFADEVFRQRGVIGQPIEDCHLSERRYGSFQRSFTVLDGIDAEKIDATSRTAN